LKRKLLLLNLTLGLLAIYAGWQLRRTWRAAKAREAATMSRRVPVAPAPPFTPLPRTAPVVPGGYSEIVQQTLFDRSRNPVVVVELPKEEPKPTKPMPRLPIYHGQMNLGDGVTVVMSEDNNSAHQGLRVGEMIGQFKLVDVNTEEITLEWEGQKIRKKLDELREHADVPQAGAPPPVATLGPARTDAPAPAVQASPQGPGADTGGGYRACQANDSNPSGAVVEGYRKVIIPNPFGQMCRWEAVR
jgi:hypothetical protein